ncbi:MAG: carbohydrate kinase [Mycetocola sp.]
MSFRNHPATAGDVLVLGETVIDIVDRDGVQTEHVGGSPANVAVSLARLGHRVRLVTDIGDDERGHRARAHFRESHVEVASGETGRTPTAIARIQADGSAEYTFDITWDPPVPELHRAAHVHTGSIAAFLSPGAETVRNFLESLPFGVTTSLDPNIRPALIGSHAEALHTFETLAAVCTVVKLSDEDARWLYPAADPTEVVDRLLEMGVRLAVVTRGGDGLLVASRLARLEVPAATIAVADTIGSGDSAMGAIIDEVVRAGLESLTEASLRRIGTWAATVAGVTTSRAGANPPWRRELLGDSGVGPSPDDPSNE